MKNVIIVSSGGARYAFELRWVREVVSLGHVTRVPGAPPHIAGVVNVHGSITPVLEVSAFGVAAGETTSDAPRRHETSPHLHPHHPHRGDGAVLVEVEDMVAAIRMDAVDEVSTVAEKSIEQSGAGGRVGSNPGRRSREDSVVRAGIVSGAVEDSRGRQVWLIDPGRMLEMAKNAALEAGAPAIQPSSPGAGHGPG